MKVRTKLGAYVAVLAMALGGGAAVGAVVGPIDVSDDDHDVEVVDHPSSDDAPASGDDHDGGH